MPNLAQAAATEQGGPSGRAPGGNPQVLLSQATDRRAELGIAMGRSPGCGR